MFIMMFIAIVWCLNTLFYQSSISTLIIQLIYNLSHSASLASAVSKRPLTTLGVKNQFLINSWLTDQGLIGHFAPVITLGRAKPSLVTPEQCLPFVKWIKQVRSGRSSKSIFPPEVTSPVEMDVAGGQEVVFYRVHSLTDFHYYHLLCFFYRKTEGNASRVTPAQCRRSSVSTRDFSFPLFPTLHLNSSDPNYFWKWDREQMAPSSCVTCWWQLHCPVLLWSAVSQLELMWAKNSARDGADPQDTRLRVRGEGEKKTCGVCPDSSLRYLYGDRRAADMIWYGTPHI